MIFGKREFCKTCHIPDYILQCYDAGHQMVADGKIIVKLLTDHHLCNSDFGSGGNVVCNRCHEPIASEFPHHYSSKIKYKIDPEDDKL